MPAFVAKHTIAVIRVADGDPRFHDGVQRWVAEVQGSPARVSRNTIALSPTTAAWFHDREQELGLEPRRKVRAGYYLFVDGRVVAHHNAIADLTKDAPYLALTGAVAAIAAAFGKNDIAGAIAEGGFAAAGAARVIDYFSARLNAARDVGAQPVGGTAPHGDEAAEAQRRVDDEAYADACAAFGVPLDVDADTFKRVWKEAARRWHPDRAPQDPSSKQKAHDRFVALNDAQALICERRGF